jgi:hypothetical protein
MGRFSRRLTGGRAQSRTVQLAYETGLRVANLNHAPSRAAGAANASIHRDLVLLKRMSTLATLPGKRTVRPHILLLRENDVRKSFRWNGGTGP